MTFVTQWFRVGHESPAEEKPGIYEVKFNWPGNPIIRMTWDGKKWKRNGILNPSKAWGDKWRGLFECADT